jgi:type IV secretory pathway VirB10-like protein
MHIYIQIILFNTTLDKGNIQKATDESTTMAKARRTPRPRKSPAKAKAAVNQMMGDATNAPHSPNQSDDSDEPDVPDEAEMKVEAEQKIQVDDFFVDDGATGIQSVMEAAAAVVSLSGVTTKKIVLAVGPKKPKAKKLSPSKRKTMAPKARKPGPPSDDQVFWLHFYELCRYKDDHGTMTVHRSKQGTNNVLANWIHYIRKRYAANLLADKYKSSLNGINFEWTAGQITKKASKAGLQNLWSITSKMAPSKFWGRTKK